MYIYTLMVLRELVVISGECLAYPGDVSNRQKRETKMWIKILTMLKSQNGLL